MTTATPAVEFVVLLPVLTEAEALAAILDSLMSHGAAATTVPPQRGAGYFGELRAAEPGRHTVYVLVDEPRLRQVGAGMPGHFVVATHPGAAPPLPGWDVVASAPGEELLALAGRLVDLFAGVVFPPAATAIVAGARRARGDEPVPVPEGPRPFPTLLQEFDSASLVVDPFEAAVARSAARRATVAPALLDTPRGGRGEGLVSTLRRLRVRGADDRELVGALTARAPMVVVVGSRKGGVGKTSHAAGIAIAAGEALDRAGRRVALVDANVANPDAWGHLCLPPQAATVRQLAAALAQGRPAPRPVNATTPALACYPETREGAEYTRSDVRRIAAHLRDRFALVVVDMSNRLPDVTAGPEAAVAAFWLDEADALVLPTATARDDFNAVLDYLDVGDLPPVIVPCIVPASRRTRNHPVVRRYREEIAARTAALVDIPDEADRVRLAGLDSVPVQDVSDAMRAAYRSLCGALAALPRRRR
ncbi:MAG: P-loop NTPase family protein [Candidatus Dormibacteria bacterium]